MRNPNRLLLLFVLITAGTSAQQVPDAPKEAASRPLVLERDKAREDQVVKQFETIRTDAKLPPMTRIKHRDSLEQFICTIALRGSLQDRRSSAISTTYRTTQPELVSPELRKVAKMEDFHFTNKSDFVRYSVAVWRVKYSQSGEVSYWVGVQLYWGAAAEFFEEHFTDDLYWRNDWKKQIAPECRGK